MADPPLLISLGYILTAAAIVMLVARLANVPSIVSYIVAGLALGPVTGLLEGTETIHTISEVGIVLLLFLVGLELSLDKIRDVGRVALAVGAAQMAATAAAGFGLGLLLGFDPTSAAFIAVALTFSSTVVVVKLLEQKRELHNLYGRIAVGVLLVQDLAVIGVLTFLAGLGSPDALSLPVLARGLGGAFVGMLLMLAVALLAARYLLPRVFGWVSSSTEVLFIWSLCWCFLLVLLAGLLELSPEIGAFLAGVSLAQLPYNHNLRRRVHPLMNFFIAVFFVGLGLEMELAAAGAQLLPAIVLAVAVLLGKPLLLFWLLRRSGYGETTALRTGITLGQISEFSFIATAMGLQVGLIGEPVLALVGLVGLITIAVSSYMILHDRRIYGAMSGIGWLRAARPGQTEEQEREDTAFHDHMIVVGMNSLGRQLVRQLAERGETVVAIDTDPRKLEDIPAASVLGSAEYLSVLEDANLPEAKLLISALQIEDTNNFLAYQCGRLGVPSSIHAFDKSVVDELRSIGVSHLMISKNIGIRRIAAELRKTGILDT